MMRIYIGNSGWLFGYLLATYPDRLGWIMTPHDMRYPDSRIRYIFDNGVWSDFINNREFDSDKFYRCFTKLLLRQRPQWVVVPDRVGDAATTLALWQEHEPQLRQYRVPLFIAAQDGMHPADIPKGSDGIFVGGTTEWKWRTLPMWTEHFARVHVGRVNTYRLLEMAHRAGAESVDGSGWFRGDPKQVADLVRYLDETTNGKQQTQLELL
jgi:hypothetical protein